jgi:protocatechuate 3,4-dioxygenase beta subunit
MPNRSRVVLTAAVLVLLAGVLIFLLGHAGPEVAPAPVAHGGEPNANATPSTADLGAAPAKAAVPAAADAREQSAAGGRPTGVRGIVLDAKTGVPLGGVDVVALKDEPSIEPLIARFRGLFSEGMFASTRAPVRELGRTVSNPDGTFELLGIDEGRVFLDGFSDGWFVRTPASARLARGQVVDGIELRASPAGRVRGIVLGADGGPAAGAQVSVRPGLNSFFGQITERQYRWRETVTDKNGRFDVPGVPAGTGYTVAASAPYLALEEVHGVDVRVGQVTEVSVQGHQGAAVAGRVVDARGEPLAGANVAMVYLDISRVLFSADGRDAPITTGADGRFRLEHVAAGRVAFVAAAADQAPSNIEELAVVDGGVYEDVTLQLGEGALVRGRVVDDQKQPVAGAAVELRPLEQPNDPQFLKMMLKVRRVEATTDADGVFVAKGLTGERLIVQAQKTGYTTAVRFGVKLDEPELVIEIQRGVTVRGKVMAGEQPLTRFRVETRTSPIPKTADASASAGAKTDGDGKRASSADRADEGDRGGPPWLRRGGRQGTRQLAEGQNMMDRGFNGLDGDWHEIQAADGTFALHGVPPGRVRVRVRAEGCLEPASQEVDLQPAQTSDVLVFQIAAGERVVGRVVDETGKPVSDAQVTAYKQRDGGGGGGRGPFNFQVDTEDFDFLGLSSAINNRSAISDSKGKFTIQGLEPGKYRFTARHPDLAKSSAKDVEIKAGVPTPEFEIKLDGGGAVEGVVTGVGMRPLPEAMMVAFSLQSGTMRSSPTDKAGFYRIDGLPPGQYVIFKSRLDERADNIPLELLSNMRLKTVTVRQSKTARLDVHDEGEDGVRVFGIVREGGAPVPRALVTLLGSDRDGILGMGVRAHAADMQGRYELTGIKPGSYVVQVTRFQGRPVQTTFEVDVPEEQREFAFDIALPTSAVSGRVIDTHGKPVANMQVTLGNADGALAGAEGLIGMIAQNGLAQARTDNDGQFTLRSVSAGTYRLTAGSRFGPRRGGGNDSTDYGEATLDGVLVDGTANLENLVITVPLAGRIAGLVVDGSGAPVAAADISYVETGKERKRVRSNPLLDLVGAQTRPIRTGADGRFEVKGLTPGTYAIKVDSDALQAGSQDGVAVAEDATADVTLHVVRGARLRVRATNVDKKAIPFGWLSLLDGRGKPVVSGVSTLTVMKRLMQNRDSVQDSGWYEFGSVPPDTYTAILAEPGKPEIRIVRTIADGETVEWDIDVAAELAARDQNNKK